MTPGDPTTTQDPIPSTLDGEAKWKRTTFGSGLVKGLGITLRHLFSKSVTVQYPDEKDVLPPRSRGVIALKEENCTMCMLCGRECPDWCIYIEGHKERREPKEPGKRAKAFNVLDRFAIDYALCMYCGICVEVCPYDALFWSPFFEYAEYDIVELTHEKPRLNEWMYHVLPPPPLDEGAKGPEFKLPAPKAAAAAPAAPAAAAPAAPAAAAPAAPAPPAPAPAPAAAPAAAGEDPAAIRKRVYEEELAKGSDPRVAESRSKAAEMRAKKALRAGAAPAPAAAAAAPAAPPAAAPAAAAAAPAPAAPAPAAAPPPPAAAPGAPAAAAGEDPAAARKRVYEEELAKGSDPRVAESRSKAAEMRAKKALAAASAGAAAPGPTTAAAGPAVPEAPAEAAAEASTAVPAAPGGPSVTEAAAEAAPAEPEAPKPPIPASGLETLDALRERVILLNTLVPPEQVGAMTAEDAAVVRQKVYDDEIAKGTEQKVAESLAKLAEVVALQGFRRPDWK